MKFRINPLVVKDLKEICDYIADANVEKAAETIERIYNKFENIQLFPRMGAELFKRVSFRTNYKYAIWNDYVVIYKIGKDFVEIYRVVNRKITRKIPKIS
ncbi:MAG: type II toxin-antitoxin system RelE/ParE family toxin [Lachnospiraceae bacterium]|nr:type II toxin-antitoxin system RelE/ParE family toxin [Lachnospiraceae bacterium]